MQNLEAVADQIREIFDKQSTARDQALTQSRALIRHCALAIRAVHRDDIEVMNEHLEKAASLAKTFKVDLAEHPDLYHTGYTQDALKEFVEAKVTCALIKDRSCNVIPKFYPPAVMCRNVLLLTLKLTS